jgi:hypothetical protein
MADSWQAPNQPTFNKSTTILLSDGGHRYPGTAMTKTRTKMPPAIRLCRRGGFGVHPEWYSVCCECAIRPEHGISKRPS